MSIFKVASGKHGYYTPERAGEFLAFVYLLTTLPDGEKITIDCASRRLVTIRQQLSYGRQFITEQAGTEYPAGDFVPYGPLACNVIINAIPDHNNVTLTATSDFFVILHNEFKPTPLFSFFRAVDSWLSHSPHRSFSHRWDPPLSHGLIKAVERYILIRRRVIVSSAVSPNIVVLQK